MPVLSFTLRLFYYRRRSRVALNGKTRVCRLIALHRSRLDLHLSGKKREESVWTPSCGVACQSFRSHSVVSLSMPLTVSRDLEWRDWCNVQSESTGAVSRECRNGELSRNSLTSTWLNCSLGNNAGGELRSEAKWMEMTSDWRPSADWCSRWYHRLGFFCSTLQRWEIYFRQLKKGTVL